MFGLVVYLIFFFWDSLKKHVYLVFEDVVYVLKKHAFIVVASQIPDLV
jgi:hypothetical protein